MFTRSCAFSVAANIVCNRAHGIYKLEEDNSVKMEDLDLNVPEIGIGVSPARQSKFVPVALSFVMLLLVIVVGIVSLLLYEKLTIQEDKSGLLAADELKALAVKLEDRGVPEESARFWEQYIQSSALSKKEKSAGALRLGRLYQQERKWGKALSWYYLADSWSTEAELSADVGRRIQECFEGMGAVSALSRELKERTALDQTKRAQGEKYLVEIDGQKFYQSDLEELIESEVDMKLASLGGQANNRRLARERERLIKDATALPALQNRLNSFIVEELLSREARRLGLDKNEEIRSYLRYIERQLLSQKLLNREINSRLQVSSTDIKNHYLANQDKFIEPGGVAFKYVILTGRDRASQLHAQASQAGNLSPGALSGSTVEIKESVGLLTEAGSWPFELPPGGTQDILAASPGEILRIPMAADDEHVVLEVTDRREKKLPPLEEINSQVERDLAQLKAAEIQDSFFKQLKDRYDVVVNSSLLLPEAGDGRDGSGEKPKKKNDATPVPDTGAGGTDLL